MNKEQIQERREAINHLFHQDEWEELVNLQRELKEKALLDLLRIDLDDANLTTKTAYFRGKAEMISELWRKINTYRKGPGEKSKGVKHANKKVREEPWFDDEDDFDDQY